MQRTKLPVAFDVDDDLRAYALAFFNAPRAVSFLGRPVSIDNARVGMVHRAGRYQIERCIVPPNTVIPEHLHPHADTIEVTIRGAVRLEVNGVDPFSRIPDEHLARFAQMRGIRINRDDAHGGRTLQDGAVFLSVQRWTCEPMGVLTDYIGRPMSSRHESLLCQ